jgi:hypothetical protein
MNLRLIRKWFSRESTMGEVYIGEDFECYSLEDAIREGPKVYGRTAIPEGEYLVAITYSQRFRKEMPLLLNVPGFEGIRIHSGNVAEDTNGCILVGQTKGQDWIGRSRIAYDLLFAKIRVGFLAGLSVTLKIISDPNGQNPGYQDKDLSEIALPGAS